MGTTILILYAALGTVMSTGMALKRKCLVSLPILRNKLVEEYKASKKAKDDTASRKQAMIAAEKRYSEYERLKKEFE